jgi:ABC-type transporter Mla subunit MlaD
MDDWSKLFFNSLGEAVQDWAEQLSSETERWVEELAENLAHASETFVRTTDQWAEQVQAAIDPEIDRIVDELSRSVEPLEISLDEQIDEVADQINQVLGPVLVEFTVGLDQWFEEVAAPLNNTVDPLLQNHPACVGCRNYYGQAHGGNMLVCAMHPFGPEDVNQCSDWESVWPGQDDDSEQRIKVPYRSLAQADAQRVFEGFGNV